MNRHVDVAVIGAGSAGMTAYRAAGMHSKNVVLIEGGAYGTTCARVGCMPSKLLIAAADAAHGVAEAGVFGIEAGPVRIDGRAVMARVRGERDRFVNFVLDNIERAPVQDRLRAYARFVAADRLLLDDGTELVAKAIVIATGSTPQIPPQLRALGERVIVSDDVFDWQDLPRSVAVVGTGVIGLELGQALHRLGVRVTLFGRSGKLAGLADSAVLASAVAGFGAELDLRLHTEIISAARDADGVTLLSRGADGQQRSEHFQFVLAATGRTPNVAGLGLEHTGLLLDPGGLPLFDPHTMQCGDSRIFIAGDANNERPLLHEATDQGRIAGDNAGRFPDVRAGLRRTPLAIAFTEPQVAQAGQAAGTLVKGAFEYGEVSFHDQGRSRVMHRNTGLLRVYGEHGSKRFLGAEMFGPRAEHIGHLLAWACQAGMTVPQMFDMPFYHPVVEEGLRTALRDLQDKLVGTVSALAHCADCTPGM